MLRIAVLVCVVFLGGCGSLPIGGSAAPQATSVPPTATAPSAPTTTPLLTIDEVLREFDAHALRVDFAAPAPAPGIFNTVPVAEEIRYVYNTNGEFLLIYRFASVQDARAFATSQASTRVTRFPHRNIVLAFDREKAIAMDYHVIVLATLR